MSNEPIIHKISMNLFGLYKQMGHLPSSKLTEAQWGSHLMNSMGEWPNVIYNCNTASIKDCSDTIFDKNPMIIIDEDNDNDEFNVFLKTKGYKRVTRWPAMAMQSIDADPYSFREELNLVSLEEPLVINKWCEMVNLSLYKGKGISPELLSSLLTIDGLKCWFGYIDKFPVFTLMSYHKGSISGFYNISVHPDYRSKGVAEMFLRQVSDQIFEMGYKHIVLQANVLSHPLYERLGFDVYGYYSIYAKLV